METSADWSDTPADQIGPEVLAGAIVEDNAKMSSGLSDVVDGIDIHAGEDELLESPPPSIAPQDTQIVVSVQSGMLPTNMPPTTIVLDDRVRVPEVPMTSNDLPPQPTDSNLTSNDLEMTSNDSESMIEVSLPPARLPTTTSSTTSSIEVPTSTPKVIWSHTRPQVMANLQAGRPALAAPMLLGPVSDYAASIPFVEKWKYIPNPDGTVRMPNRILEQHVRQRLSPTDRTRLQMSAHRNFKNFKFAFLCWYHNISL